MLQYVACVGQQGDKRGASQGSYLSAANANARDQASLWIATQAKRPASDVKGKGQQASPG